MEPDKRPAFPKKKKVDRSSNSTPTVAPILPVATPVNLHDDMEAFATPIRQLNHFVLGSIVHVRAETNSSTLPRFSTTIGPARFISYSDDGVHCAVTPISGMGNMKSVNNVPIRLLEEGSLDGNEVGSVGRNKRKVSVGTTMKINNQKAKLVASNKTVSDEYSACRKGKTHQKENC
mmetsp:Transcript_42642/g.54814  ORF Transcript_42642/g.54814 Transcript_42642/m.54814 type:complete len:176 (-) Transcript_42642:1594-2121(-)